MITTSKRLLLNAIADLRGGSKYAVFATYEEGITTYQCLYNDYVTVVERVASDNSYVGTYSQKITPESIELELQNHADIWSAI